MKAVPICSTTNVLLRCWRENAVIIYLPEKSAHSRCRSHESVLHFCSLSSLPCRLDRQKASAAAMSVSRTYVLLCSSHVQYVQDPAKQNLISAPVERRHCVPARKNKTNPTSPVVFWLCDTMEVTIHSRRCRFTVDHVCAGTGTQGECEGVHKENVPRWSAVVTPLLLLLLSTFDPSRYPIAALVELCNQRRQSVIPSRLCQQRTNTPGSDKGLQ